MSALDMSLARTTSRSSPEAQSGAFPAAPRVGRLHVVTFGCQMNKYDSELVEGRFVQRGWSTTPDPAEADLILFNTCSVREHAEQRVFSWLGELKHARERRPGLVVGVMGCMAQRVEAEIYRRAGHVDLVVGTRSFQRLPELVDELHARRAAGQDGRISALDMDAHPDLPRMDQTWSGGREGYIAVMRGCDLNCTFCIVPTVRGRVLSRPLADIVAEARWMVDQGARVITLLGQTVNSYGEDLPAAGAGQPRGLGRQGRTALADLLYALQDVAGLQRVRLITLHPAYVTAALARAISECDKVERFLPLPAQSGSDSVLKRMKRGYTADLYRSRSELLREHVPDIELGSDWIVGFPGETEADVAASEAFLAEQGFLVNYVFQYDPRPTTAAAGISDDVPRAEKKARNQRLLRAGESSSLARHRAWLGRDLDVLVESEHERRPGELRGRSRHGMTVSFRGEPALVGTRVLIAAEDASPYGLAGRLVEQTAER
jgi:tRNA-2-methylthio-N6-dimethylallyladenosine synthase